MSDTDIRKKKVYLVYKFHPQQSTFIIKDQGQGFNWRKTAKQLGDGVVGPHGRGITITSQSIRNLRYNEKGNQVAFDVMHQQSQSNLKPKIFDNSAVVHFQKDEVVFEKGETSDFLYYIASGHYHIMDSSDRAIATLTPNDIFIGEMAFLLSEPRSATVKAALPGQLIRLSKKEFFDALKEFPHYGLFLARLVAKRLARMNQRSLDPLPAAELIKEDEMIQK